jgi:hypothetical protein
MAYLSRWLSSLVSRVLPQKLIDWLAHASSSRHFLMLIVVLTVGWLAVNRLVPHPVDDWRTGYPLLVLAFTIYFGIVEGVMKVVQAEDSARQRKSDQLVAQQTQTILAMTQEMRRVVKRGAKNEENLIVMAQAIRDSGIKTLDELNDTRTLIQQNLELIAQNIELLAGERKSCPKCAKRR